VRPPIHITRRPAASQSPSDDNDNFVNTGDDGIGAPTALMASAEDMTDAGANTPGADNRDYSLVMPPATAGPGIVFQQGTPIVPNSSFSYQYTLGDSARPEEQLLYLQQSAQREVLAAIVKLQQQTAIQLKELSDLQSKAVESVHLRRQIRAQKEKLQRDYLKKITGWQKKLETSTHIRMIVYI
jgi:hypothetical protein